MGRDVLASACRAPITPAVIEAGERVTAYEAERKPHAAMWTAVYEGAQRSAVGAPEHDLSPGEHDGHSLSSRQVAGQENGMPAVAKRQDGVIAIRLGWQQNLR